MSLGKRAEINVFTVASGHLYEVIYELEPLLWLQSVDKSSAQRMSFLMMISVMRHTKSSVKFWFIQNFLSPSFKAFIPHLAQGEGIFPFAFGRLQLMGVAPAEYGFDYELVTYKWPHWLRGQKEKQRTIWGSVVCRVVQEAGEADPARPAATRSSSSTCCSRSSSTASFSSTRTSASKSPGRRLDQILTRRPPQDRARGPEGAGRPRPRRRSVCLRAHGRLRRREARDGGLPLLEDWVRCLSASPRD